MSRDSSAAIKAYVICLINKVLIYAHLQGNIMHLQHVIGVNMHVDRQTGKSRGLCHVTLDSRDALIDALHRNGQVR